MTVDFGLGDGDGDGEALVALADGVLAAVALVDTLADALPEPGVSAARFSGAGEPTATTAAAVPAASARYDTVMMVAANARLRGLRGL